MDALSLQSFLRDFEPHSHDEGAAGGSSRSHVPFPTCVFHWIYIGIIIIIDNTCSNNSFFNALTILFFSFKSIVSYDDAASIQDNHKSLSDCWVDNTQLTGINYCTIYWYTNPSFSLLWQQQTVFFYNFLTSIIICSFILRDKDLWNLWNFLQ